MPAIRPYGGGRPEGPGARQVIDSSTRLCRVRGERWWMSTTDPRKENIVSAPTLDRTWSEEAGAVHVEAHAVDFTVDLIPGPAVETVVVRGELDLATAPLLRSVLDLACTDRAGRVDLNLSAVTFLDAYALSTVIAAHRRLSARGAVLLLRDPSPIVRRVIELTCSDRAIPVTTRGEAA